MSNTTETVTIPAETLRDLLRCIEANVDSAERSANNRDVCEFARNARRAVGELKTFLPTQEPEIETPAPRKPRASNAPKAIRRVVMICREFGCDFKDRTARRTAAEKLFGRTIESCEELSIAEWWAFGDAIKFRGLRF